MGGTEENIAVLVCVMTGGDTDHQTLARVLEAEAHAAGTFAPPPLSQ